MIKRIMRGTQGIGILATLAVAALVSTGCQSTPQKVARPKYTMTATETREMMEENALSAKESEREIREMMEENALSAKESEREIREMMEENATTIQYPAVQYPTSSYDASEIDAKVQEARGNTDFWRGIGQTLNNPYLMSNSPFSQALGAFSTGMEIQAKKHETRTEYDAIRAEIRARNR